MLIRKSYNTCRDYIDQHKVAIVCSARSGSTKTLGTTNLLLRASAEVLRRDSIHSSNGNGNGNKSSPPDNPGTGTVTPVTRSLFGVYGMTPNYRSVSQSPPSSPISRSSSDFRGNLTFTPITVKGEKGEKVHQVPDFVNTVELLRQEHLNAARECVTKHEEILRELEEEIERDCDWLTSFLYALKARLALLIDQYH